MLSYRKIAKEVDDTLLYSHLLKTASSQSERFLSSVKEESRKRLPATNIKDLEVLTQQQDSHLTHYRLIGAKQNNSPPYKRTANMNTMTWLNVGNKEKKRKFCLIITHLLCFQCHIMKE